MTHSEARAHPGYVEAEITMAARDYWQRLGWYVACVNGRWIRWQIAGVLR